VRCKFCGKNNPDDISTCENCGQLLDEQTKEKSKKSDNTVSLLLALGLLNVISGLILLVLSIKGGYVFLICALISLMNAAVFLSVDSRLSKLEEIIRLNEKDVLKSNDNEKKLYYF
jgi:uncharacterized membrane protein YvbJ